MSISITGAAVKRSMMICDRCGEERVSLFSWDGSGYRYVCAGCYELLDSEADPIG